MVRREQELANLTEGIKFRVVASFDTVQTSPLSRGTLGIDIKFKVCTNWTFRRDDERDDWKKEMGYASERSESPATNHNPSFSFCTGTFIKLDSKGTEGCGCNLRKQHGVGEREGRKDAKQSIWNATRVIRPTTIVGRWEEREVTVQMHFA